MTAQGAEAVSGEPGFETAVELKAREDRRRLTSPSLAGAPAAHDAELATVQGELVVRPALVLDDAKRLWNDFLDLKRVLLADPDCFDEIGGKKQMNRTGATRLATVFALTLEVIQIAEADVEPRDHRFLVRVRASRGLRYADGIATCRVSEISATTAKGEPVPYSEREHFALTRADTRARKRAIADLLGGTEAE